ncbi:YdiU family protein [Rhizobium sp. CFBP 8762]|uniref:protein adenylyltransferase SelO n=1 Tax=Rhizobium sp. CFBP 8762 TaxID=2775279 RepID=UPI001786981E|nr:YdiU family protein [Rhizobium sp. CFBP 8762]MBD8554141.1 YdiU family protein [Rhizobium sp. CFBP 8762]
MFSFDNSYARLPDTFFSRMDVSGPNSPTLIKFNETLALELGLNVGNSTDQDLAALFSGSVKPEGADPLAMAYAGHQFGNFVPQLGDGRAVLLGEVIDRSDQRRDIQLKGAGETFYSRGGDGRAALGPVLREYCVSEAMYALGIPSTRALAAVLTGEPVYREQTLPGAVVTRVASSHIRVGTFQFFAARQDADALRQLSDYVIQRHYPEVADTPQPYLNLLKAIIDRQAYLVARWMQVGFIHGVMNTDNMSVAGETIDFGPCAFMDQYDPTTVYSAIDSGGRYAYQNQPGIAQWNLARLAEALLPILADDIDEAVALANPVVVGFAPAYQAYWLDGFRQKLGLMTERDDDRSLIEQGLQAMFDDQADFTLSFRALSAGSSAFAAFTSERPALTEWAALYQARLALEPEIDLVRREKMESVNPVYIPRNHRIEQAIQAALGGDLSLFHKLVDVLAHPYEAQTEYADYQAPPRTDERVLQTFCGT